MCIRNMFNDVYSGLGLNTLELTLQLNVGERGVAMTTPRTRTGAPSHVTLGVGVATCGHDQLRSTVGRTTSSTLWFCS